MTVSHNDICLFYIDSHKRINSIDSHGNFSFQLDMPIGNNYDKVVLMQALIPKSYYAITDGYNTFTLQEGITTATITMPEGNYTKTTFATVLTTLLNNASISMGNNFTYTISYPTISQPNTGKFTYNVSGNGITQPDRKSTRLNSSHVSESRMPSSA